MSDEAPSLIPTRIDIREMNPIGVTPVVADGSMTAALHPDQDVYDDGFLRVEHNSYYVSCNGTALLLPRKEFLILSRLAPHRWPHSTHAGTVAPCLG